MLGGLYAAGGPAAILSIGQKLDRVAQDPIWAAALNSADPWILLDKWNRFEGFAHWNNRTRIEKTSGQSIHATRYAVDGNNPTDAENLLICGLLAGLLTNIGCRGLWCELTTASPSSVKLIENGKVLGDLDLSAQDTRKWQISWDKHVPKDTPTPNSGKTERVIEGHVLGPDLKAAVDHIVRDPGRSWTLAAFADVSCMSRRTLQRRLEETGLSFSRIVRLVRVFEACDLLETTDMPITAIAFCAGFSDSSHFSRDFLASTGLPPREYRKVTGATPGISV